MAISMQLPPALVKPSRRAVLATAPLGFLAPNAVLAQPMPAPVPGSSNLETALEQLDGLAEQAMNRTKVPGIALAVVSRDELVYLKGFGLCEVGKPELVDPDTVFQLASVSKPIATTVIAALVGDGLVAWDDPIVRHDPEFQMYDPWVTREVTLRDMLAHRSGLPDHAGDLLEDIGYDRQAILYRLRYEKPGYSFRAHFAYTNFGFTEAAVAAAKASGRSWEDLSAERLYRPLGMTSTSSRYADFAASANRAHGHVLADGEWVAKYTRDPDAQSPAGGVSSSIRDMAQWLRLQLARGRFAGKGILGAAALDETHIPQIVRVPPHDPQVGHAGFCGLGWNIDYDAAGRVHWSHSGGFELGAATSVNLLPGEDLGIVALTNAQPIGVPEAVSRSFLDLILTGKVERDWFDRYRRLFAATLAPDYPVLDYSRAPVEPSPALPAAAYIGDYRNEYYGTAEIAEAAGGDGGLVLRLGPRPTPYPLKNFDRDVFGYEPPGENAAGPAAVVFTVGRDGKATAMTLANLDKNGQGTFRRTTAR
jgi:CubicO group peptidase (beta-lactamase class C family)